MRVSISGCPQTSTRHFSTGYPLLLWGSRIEKETKWILILSHLITSGLDMTPYLNTFPISLR